jgi:hypothetical protein
MRGKTNRGFAELKKLFRVNVSGQLFRFRGEILRETDWSLIILDDKQGELELSKSNIVTITPDEEAQP